MPTRSHNSIVLACLLAATLCSPVRGDEVEFDLPEPPVATDDAAPQVENPPVEADAEATDGEEGEPEPAPVYEPVDSATVETWVGQLGSPSYDERETARRNLIKAGPQVLGPVVEAAQRDVLEVSVRAMSVFHHLYARASGEHVDAVEAALDRLLLADNASTNIRARRLLDDQYDLREERAVARIAELGGTIERSTEPTVVGGRLVVQPSTNGDGALSNIVLDPETWKGGDEGLVYVKRLTKLTRIYLVDGAISEKAREDLVATLPNLDVQGRGKAYLGIGGSAGFGGGCYVSMVKPGTAAEKAGLQAGDHIVGFAGEAVDGFPHLVELIGKHSPGETVVAKVRRNGLQEMDVEIRLGRWADNK